VDTVRQFKPARAVYEMVARELGVDPQEICLVAAHDWDVTGAMAAGWSAAFVARPRMVLNPLLPKPPIIGATVLDVAQQIISQG
jgi:2-haloacid dehalogenase